MVAEYIFDLVPCSAHLIETLFLCGSEQKWSKGKVRDKLNNLVLFDKATYDKLYKEVPNYKLITPAVVSERLKIRGSLARNALQELLAKGEFVCPIIPNSADWIRYKTCIQITVILRDHLDGLYERACVKAEWYYTPLMAVHLLNSGKICIDGSVVSYFGYI